MTGPIWALHRENVRLAQRLHARTPNHSSLECDGPLRKRFGHCHVPVKGSLARFNRRYNAGVSAGVGGRCPEWVIRYRSHSAALQAKSEMIRKLT